MIKPIKSSAVIFHLSPFSRLNGLSDPEENLESVEEVNQGRLDCLQEWTDKRLDVVVISMPHRDPFRLLCECCTSLSPDNTLLQLPCATEIAFT